MQRKLISLLFGGLLLAALPVYAQQVNLTGTSALTVSVNPAYPGPNSTAQLTAESPLLDLQSSDIEWTVNGSPAGSGQSITIKTGGLGTQTVVNVSVSGASGQDSTQITIAPASVDLLWEGTSYVPPFYKGRALPGSNSSVRVLAMPRFVNGTGAVVPSSNIDFTWKLNGAVDRAQSGLGESSAVFPAATLFDSDTIDVVAQTPDGSLSGENSVTIRTGQPELLLYEDSPLFGVMYHQALPSSSAASESEVSFAAVPYFADAVSANDPSLAYQWVVNGSPVATDAQDPSEITIGAQSGGTANVGLSISNSSDPFFSASGSWSISFSGSGATSNNAFHTPQ